VARPELGVWVGGRRDETGWAELLDRWSAAGVTMAQVNVGAGLEAIASLVPAAAERGIRVHAWKPTMMNGSMVEEHPEWYVVSRDGLSAATDPPYVGYYHFLCPTRAPVRGWVREQIREVAEIPGLASVHLDYIRFPDVILPEALWPKYGIVQDREYPPYDFCYCKVCRETFASRSGYDPLSLDDPTADEAWRRFRWDAITRVVSELYEVAHGAGTAMTAAVFPTPAIARRLVRQDWVHWALDGVMPMIYNGFYNEPVEWVGEAAAEGVSALDGRVPLYAGLYVPDLDPPALARGARLALDAGAAGVTLFNAGSMTEDHWAAVGIAMRRTG
jgi:uncharacterized lipoprotein YddW (UPF0748 family)